MGQEQDDAALEQRVAAVRQFNRLYTQTIGVLHEALLDSPYSLTQVRVLWELAHQTDVTAGVLTKLLGIDAGYLSRILTDFEARGLVARTRSSRDGRVTNLSLTKKGSRAFAPLDRRSHDEVEALLRKLTPGKQQRLVGAMQAVQTLLGNPAPRSAPYILRPHRPGDMGWVIHRHAVLYRQEYGWDETFEALVAEIAAKFIRDFDPKRERCWIAERDGEIMGSVFCVKESPQIAKLRLLLVEPAARGSGLGRALVDECIRFARLCGYVRLTLWTNDTLLAARRIYEAAGFELVKQEQHRSFGHDLVGQYWELAL
jgi:DNA-binding MarR family transcriptional regulator/GNAT superfamily N-acetyltransferase